MEDNQIRIDQIFSILKQYDEMVADYLGAPRRSDEAIYLEAVDKAKQINKQP